MAISRRADLYATVPVQELVRRGCIEPSGNIATLRDRVLSFYGVAGFDERPQLWPPAARTRAAELDWEQWAWLVRARQLAPAVPVGRPFTDATLDQALQHLRSLLLAPEAVRHVPRVLAEAGIRFLVVEHFARTRWDGACFWLDRHSPVVVLSMRHDRIDHFWHTVMHELWHVRRQDGVDNDTLPMDESLVERSRQPGTERVSDAEALVDSLAADTVIPRAEMQRFIDRVGPLYATRKIKGAAERLNVHPGLVVGRLQTLGQIDWSHGREMLVKVRPHVIAAAFTDGWGRDLPPTAA